MAFSAKKVHFQYKIPFLPRSRDPVDHPWSVQGSLERVTTCHWWPKFQISQNFYCFSVLTRSVSLRCNFSCEYLQLREKKFWEKREDFCWFLFGVVDEEVFFSSLTPPRHVIPPAELEMPRCESSRSRYRYTTPAPHREMTQYQPPINLYWKLENSIKKILIGE